MSSLMRGDEPADRNGESRRISELATLPVFLKLAGKRAVIAGGQDAALWKAELLSAAGARVDVYASDVSPAFEALAKSQSDGRITFLRRSWIVADLQGAAIAIGAVATDEDAAAFSTAARAAGVPVNVIDRPDFCDFQFGAIVNRSPLIIGISTDGAAPVFGQAIRSAIEGLVPSNFKHWAEAAKCWRRFGDRLGADMGARRRFWERFTQLAFNNADRMPVEADVEALLAAGTGASSGVAAKGVTIVSLGNGDADDLTLGAVRALRTADHLSCEDGVPAAVSDFCRREASRSRVVKDAFEENVGELISLARTGKRVVHVQRGYEAGGVTPALTSAGLLVTVIHSGRVSATATPEG